jgi:hypothetical protein
VWSPSLLISSGLSQNFEFIFIFFLFFHFFSEETTSNQADLQDSMETNRLLQKQLKLPNLKFSKSCSAPHLATRQQVLQQGQHNGGTNSSDNDTIGTGSSNLQGYLSVSEPTEA